MKREGQDVAAPPGEIGQVGGGRRAGLAAFAREEFDHHRTFGGGRRRRERHAAGEQTQGQKAYRHGCSPNLAGVAAFNVRQDPIVFWAR